MTATVSWPCPALADEDLSRRTTLKVGGRAQWLLEPRTPDELVAGHAAARERGFEVRVLGGGANLLVPDGTLPGVVLSTERLARAFRPSADGAPAGEGEEFSPLLPELAVRERDEDPRLVVWAGYSLLALVRVTRDLGWSGFEGLAGVPGHLGGGVAMNAGGRWGELWDVVESVRVLTSGGEVRHLARGECSPRYRDGNLGGALVLGAVLRFQPERREVVRERVRDYLTQKGAAQPLTERSCGCVFQNPPAETSGGRSAGQLLEEAGAKRLSRGAAHVSEKHANFIVNRGGATAADVLGLIAQMRARVADRHGVELRTEVKIWGPDRPR
jgi:UDP-N-acetylenolpyruvoylglucosamine reductase